MRGSLGGGHCVLQETQHGDPESGDPQLVMLSLTGNLTGDSFWEDCPECEAEFEE